MSVKTKKRFKNLGKKAGGVFFLLLMFTNINLILFDDNFSLNHFNFVSDIVAKQAQAGDGNGGGGGGNYSYWFDQRTDVWTCYKTETMIDMFGVVVKCYQTYQSSVTTVVCRSGGTFNQCTVGQWHWNPRTPCSGGYSYPPCTLPCRF